MTTTRNHTPTGALHMTDPLALPEGHYAIIDPHTPTAVTYWRRKDLTAKRGTRPQFAAWPLKARYGPVLLKKDVPRDLHGKERQEWALRWFRDHRDTYITAVVEAIAADPIAAQRTFAEMTCRCCVCGRCLVDDLSKTYGIGPDCRSGIPAETLAAYLTPRVGAAHAEHLRSEPPMTAPQEAAPKCQAWDLGYPTTCINPARWKAEKHQAIPFVLCGRHLYRARRASYSVHEIGAST